MSNKSTLIVDTKVGVCTKTSDRVVTYQNDSCLRYCGNMVGQNCQKGCMKQLSELPNGALAENDFVSLKNIFPEENVLNALVINNNGLLTTLIFDVSRRADEQMLLVEPYGLTRTESSVVRMVLEGATNAEIAAKFDIARSTLKSHINHIYRKLPENLSREILGKRFSGTTPKPKATQAL